jgi:hypothetical protein
MKVAHGHPAQSLRNPSLAPELLNPADRKWLSGPVQGGDLMVEAPGAREVVRVNKGQKWGGGAGECNVSGFRHTSGFVSPIDKVAA